ncbi:MAG: oligoendopeptidase F [Clostridiales bacterium]|nr:oligoendopeptidase F [Clostridiales bacterium]
MGNKKLKTRDELSSDYKWNIEAMYDSEDKWNSDIASALAAAGEFSKFQGHLGDSAGALADALIESDHIEQRLERAYVYARMKLDEDNRVSASQARHDKAITTIAAVSAKLSFVLPEIISLPEETIAGFQKQEPRLSQYKHVLESAMREKKHVLSINEENLMAQMSEVTGATDTIFTMLNDADIKFGSVTDEDGDEVTLTHGNYINFMRSQNRDLRKDAYTHCYEAYKGLINTIAANYSYNVKTDVVTTRIRHYDSSRQASLSGDNIPESVYDNLVASVNEYLPVLHEYIDTRKKMLKVDELKMYDVYVPLTDVPERNISFEEAVSIANKGLAPLGDAYLKRFNHGISQKWIDVYENEGKTSGAYSFGSYDSYPYVLMNYDNKLEDVFTLVHEMGHSMHSSYTREAQPFTYGSHSIFTAEVASTVNESLLMKYLLKTEKDPAMHKYILNMYIEAFRTTLFRQTMFAEFEKLTHDQVEGGGSLTAEWMNEQYDKLNDKYFGPSLSHDDYIKYEWARIPHFYRSFYVYQYATGYSAATAISKKIIEEGTPARDAYIEFLKSGNSDYPVELLKIAGVDMESREPVNMAMETFKKLVEEFKGLV